MKRFRKTSITALMVTALTITACSGNPNQDEETSKTDSSSVISFTEADVVEIDENTPAGKITYLSYESGFEDSASEMITLFETRYDGSFEHILCQSGNAYFERLGTLISTGLSPDLVRYEWRSFPHGISYNMYTPLDTYIDIDSDLWKSVKELAEQFVYNGKHYYYPYKLKTSYSLNYNNRILEEHGMTDPMTPLNENMWTWKAFEDMLKQWCDMDPNHIGYNGVGGMIFVSTTGTKIVDIQGDQIINNLRNENVSRCMLWLENMRRQGLLGASDEQKALGASSGFVAPDQAFVDGNLLFLGMDPA